MSTDRQLPDVAGAGGGTPPVVTVLVVTWNGLDLLRECVASLRAQDLGAEAYRIVVVDNASSDGTSGWVCSQEGLALVELGTNRGFAGGVGAGLDHVETPFVALLNNDAVAHPSWLRELVQPFSDPTVGATTSKILLAGMEPAILQSVGVQLDGGGRGSDRGFGEVDRGQYDAQHEAWGFCGGAAALRMDALRSVGGFWPRLFLYYEDVDVSWRLRRAGWAIRFAPGAVVSHRHGASTVHGSDLFHYYNLRNRVLVLLANEPIGVALRRIRSASSPSEQQSAVATRPAPPTAVVKVRAALGALALAPLALRRRRRFNASPR